MRSSLICVYIYIIIIIICIYTQTYRYTHQVNRLIGWILHHWILNKWFYEFNGLVPNFLGLPMRINPCLKTVKDNNKICAGHVYLELTNNCIVANRLFFSSNLETKLPMVWYWLHTLNKHKIEKFVKLA